MSGWAVCAALLVIAAIVLYEVQNAIKVADMWSDFERNERDGSEQ
jgi:hypothetical protein